MRKVFLPLFISLTFCALSAHRIFAQSAAAYTVIDAASGHVLDSANADRKLQIGSITKIATAMVVLDWADVAHRDINSQATVPAYPPLLNDNNPLELQPGDSLSLRDLLYAAMMQSDNIAALTLAQHVGASLPTNSKASPTDRFVAQMNALARQLRMDHTLFVNPHGLDSSEHTIPYSTAADVARLTQYAMTKPGFRFFVSQKERRITIARAGGTQIAYSLRNTNELLGVNGIDGVKTGTTRRAGECAVISAERPPESVKQGDGFIITPRRLIVVVLGAVNRFNLAAGLLDRGWQYHQAWVAAGRPDKTRR